ncbi:MAG: PQQ-dependent sugar dehydrogenase [Pelovirga sp.]
MKKQLKRIAVFLLLLCGWLSAFVVTGQHGRSSLYLFIPVFLLGAGMGLQLKLTHIRATVLTLAVTAIAALTLLNQFFPQHSPRLSALETARPDSYAVNIEVPVADSLSEFMVERPLESTAALEIQLIARLPAPARQMLVVADRMYVTLPDLGAVYLLDGINSADFIERPILFHSGLDRPTGLAMVDERLFVAEPYQVIELIDHHNDLQVDDEQIIIDGLPDDGGHWMRSLVADSQGALYVSIGSRCNVCEEEDERRATVMKIDPDSHQANIFAQGLRHTVGLAIAPDTGILWGTDISREMSDRRPPPDELNRIIAGGDYGWPYCYGQQTPDPQLESGYQCRDTVPASVDLPPLCRPMGLAFGTNLTAPDEYRDSLYILCTGNGSGLTPPGPEIVRLGYRQGKVESPPVDFLRGWNDSWGTPIAMDIGEQGVMFISDAKNRAIYRVSWPEE